MSRNLATFDPAALGPECTLERSNTTVRVDTVATANTAAALYPKSAGQWYVEFVAYQPNLDPLDPDGVLRFGLASARVDVTGALGADGYGIALGQDGATTTGGVATAHYGVSFTVGDIVSVVADFDAGTVAWLINGALAVTVDLPTAPLGGQAWRPACTLVSGQAMDLRALLNCGQRSFEYQPAQGNAGWFDVPPGFGMLRIADRPFLTDPSDAPPNAPYAGGIAAAGFVVSRALNFWPWASNAAGSPTRATLKLDNADGRFDALVAQDVRDAAVTVRETDGATLAGAEDAAHLTVDSVRANSDADLTLTLTDTVARTQVALQHRLFLPLVDDALHAKPWPLALGAVRSIEPPCINAADQVYAVNDGPIAGIGSVRDRGDPFDYSAGDYTINQDGTITLASEAQGRVTMDTSSLGGTTPLPPTDLLDGSGDFSDPADWELGADQFNCKWVINANGVLSGSVDTRRHIDARHTTLVLAEGETYRIRITVQQLRETTYSLSQTFSAALSLHYGSTAAIDPYRDYWAMLAAGGLNQQPVTLDAYVTAPHDMSLWLRLYGGNDGWSYNANGVVHAEITKIECYHVEIDNLDDESLIPITLEACLRALLEVRAGWSPADWSAADAAAIDTATGYAGVGLYAASDSTLTVQQALDLLMPAYCACYYTDEAGVLRFARLVAPETLVPSGEITAADMLAAPVITIDTAPNLTTQLRGRKNWSPLDPSEMVTDDLGLPPSIDGGTA